MTYSSLSLSSLSDASIWKTNNITYMNYMIARYLSLSSLLDISNWNTNNVTNIKYMFAGYSSLLSVFDFSKIHKIKSLSYLTGNSKIVIKTITGKTIFIYYSFDDSIQYIKNKIKIREDIPSLIQIFFFNGQQIEDSKALKYYTIQKINKFK